MIRKGDKVKVIAGKDKGKTGKVLRVVDSKKRVIVEGVQLVKKHMRRRSEAEPGGVKEVPTSLNISNVVLLCPHCSKPTRYGVKAMGDKTKVKVCKKCQQAM